MPNPNAIVGMIARLDPPAEKLRGVEFFRRYPDGASIFFEGEFTARLFPGDRAAAMLDILEQLRQMRFPVYVEINPQTRGIMRLLIPLLTRVLALTEAAEGFTVDLEASHARHRLARNNPDFPALLQTLRTALAAKQSLIVTETDAHEIIDARPGPALPRLPEPGPAPVKERPSWFRRFCRRWFCWLCCVSYRRATQLFALCSATTCDPLTVPPPCIPFMYPDDGCWARAHEMCRLMIAAGARPKKVWIDGSLHTPTRNNPQCFVNWGWHVAPTLCVRRFFRAETMVIDPSLFTTPVTEATWKSVQGDPNATLTDTAATVYWRNVIPTDPNYVDTNIRLQFYRLQLQNRSISVGPPPYANCP
jgi:Glutaminase